MANASSQLLFEVVVVLLALFVIGWLIVNVLSWFSDLDEMDLLGCGCGCGWLILIGVIVGVIAIGYFFYPFIF